MCERKRLSAEPRGSGSHSLHESLMRSLLTQALFSHAFTLHYSVWRWAVRRACQLSLSSGPDFLPPRSLTRAHLTPVWWLNYGSPPPPARHPRLLLSWWKWGGAATLSLQAQLTLIITVKCPTQLGSHLVWHPTCSPRPLLQEGRESTRKREGKERPNKILLSHKPPRGTWIKNLRWIEKMRTSLCTQKKQKKNFCSDVLLFFLDANDSTPNVFTAFGVLSHRNNFVPFEGNHVVSRFENVHLGFVLFFTGSKTEPAETKTSSILMAVLAEGKWNAPSVSF